MKVVMVLHMSKENYNYASGFAPAYIVEIVTCETLEEAENVRNDLETPYNRVLVKDVEHGEYMLAFFTTFNYVEDNDTVDTVVNDYISFHNTEGEAIEYARKMYAEKYEKDPVAEKWGVEIYKKSDNGFEYVDIDFDYLWIE